MKITNTKVSVQQSLILKAGLGIFAQQNINSNETIETCPVLVLPRIDYPLVKQTILRNYYFMWGKTTCAICFGYGSFYNHSYTPNATYLKNIKDKTITFSAIKPIKKGEEITVNYNYGNSDDHSSLWIADIPKPLVMEKSL